MRAGIIVMVNTFIGFALCVGLGLHFSLRWDHRVLRALSVFFLGLATVLMLAYLNYIGVDLWGGQALRTGILNLLLLHLLWSIRREIVREVEMRMPGEKHE